MKIELQSLGQEHFGTYVRWMQDPELLESTHTEAPFTESSIRNLHDACSRGDAVVAIVMVDGRPVGDISCFLGRDQDSGAMVGEVNFMNADRDMRGRGVMGRALTMFADEARRRGIHTLNAVVAEKNAGSIGVLQRAGFRPQPRAADGIQLEAGFILYTLVLH